MTDKEKLNMLLEAIDYSFWNPAENDYNRELTYPVIDKVKFIKRLVQEEPVSDDLEKVAEEWDESLYRSDAFKAGANWQKEQIMKEAIDTTIKQGCTDLGVLIKGLDKDKFSFGDKVKVIIIKSE